MSAPKSQASLSVANTPVAVVAPGPCSVVTVQQQQGSAPPAYPFKVLALDGTTVLSTQQPGTNYQFAAPPGIPWVQGQTVGFIEILVAGPATFTVFADPTFGPGPRILQSVQVTLTSAQLKALQTTAVNLVPAPGVGFVVVPVSAFMQAKFKTAAYTLGNADNVISLFRSGTVTPTLGDLACAGTVDQVVDCDIAILAAAAGALTRVLTENLGIDAKLTGTTPALTVGAGTAIVTINYYVVPLA